MTTRTGYSAAFYDRAEQSDRAADLIVPIVRSFFRSLGSVLDVGCARGTWLAAWARTGCTDFIGIDGHSVRPADLLIDTRRFFTADLAAPFSLGRRFDLVQCLEVAEHLPRSRSESLVADLVDHGGAVLFSAAPPGQGGELHVNERPYEFWRGLFAHHGYLPFDCVRPRIGHIATVPFWYRYNILMYVSRNHIEDLDASARACQLPEDSAIPDVAPLSFRIRRALLRRLPIGVINRLSQLNSRIR